MTANRPQLHVVPRTWGPAELHAVRARYLRDWVVVKRARFNAAKRFERKQNASTLAFAIAGIVGIALPYFTQLFGAGLVPHTKNVLEFYGYITGALALGLGLVEQARNYSSLSRRFDECGRRVNTALRKLYNAPGVDEITLHRLVTEYEAALDICDVNHDPVDYEIALAGEERDMFRPGQSGHGVEEARIKLQRRLARLQWRETVGIYWLYWVILAGPTLIAWLVWVLAAPGVASVGGGS